MHECQALVITCIDFRFVKTTYEWLNKLGLNENYDLLTIGGVTKQIAAPDQIEFREFILKQVAISVDLHHIKQIIFIHHEDCGAYGGKSAFKDQAAEKDKFLADMQEAERIIKTKYAQLAFIKVYAQLNGTMEKLGS